MEIEFQGKYDRKLFFRAVRLANQPSQTQRRFILIMTVFAIAALVIMIYRIIRIGDLAGNVILLCGALILGGIVMWIYLAPYFTARKMWTNPGTRRKLKGQITNQGIKYNLDVGTNKIRWERFSRVRHEEDMITLVRSDGLLIIFPQRFFKKTSEWRKFVKLVEKKLVISQS